MGFTRRHGGLSGAAFTLPDADSQIGFLRHQVERLNWLTGQLCGKVGLRVRWGQKRC